MDLHAVLSMAGIALLGSGQSSSAAANGEGEFPSGHPMASDRTAVRWETSFDAARSRAKEEHRLLFVLPDDRMGMEGDGIGLEEFRANVLCDERVARLLQRRFVCFYLDVTPGTPAHDPTAAKLVIQAAPIFGQEEQVFPGGVPVLFFEPSGREVEQVRSGTNAEQFLQSLRRILDRQPKYAAPSPSERAITDPWENAQLAADLLDYPRAKKALQKVGDDRKHLGLARIARFEQDFAEHSRLLAKIADPTLASAAAIERAWGALHDRDGARMLAQLAAVTPEDSRAAEALYLRGLAHLLAGDEEAAKSSWREAVEHHSQAPLVYRADLAYCTVVRGKPSGTRSFDSSSASPSLLGHLYAGYMDFEVWTVWNH